VWRVSRIILAEGSGIVTPSVASRCASSAAATGTGITFAVHSTTMSTSPGNPAAHGLPKRPDVINVAHRDITGKFFSPLSNENRRLPWAPRIRRA
jgi:hypothetical protein